MRLIDTPADVHAHWAGRHAFSDLDRAQFRRDLDAAQNRLSEEGRTRDSETFGWPLYERCRHALRWMKPYASMRASVVAVNRAAGRRSA